jgi:23S rRNA (cytosine1962-C5)-methyltransferase
MNVLNLFAYSGGATISAAKAGAKVCHVDSAKGMITWARENAKINRLDQAPIRWIVDDVASFLRKEIRRKSFYDAIVLDPPTFGRGSKGQVFKIERDLASLLALCKQIFSSHPLFMLLTCHTPGITAVTLHHLLDQLSINGQIEQGEMFLNGPDVYPIPSGCYAKVIF